MKCALKRQCKGNVFIGVMYSLLFVRSIHRLSYYSVSGWKFEAWQRDWKYNLDTHNAAGSPTNLNFAHLLSRWHNVIALRGAGIRRKHPRALPLPTLASHHHLPFFAIVNRVSPHSTYTPLQITMGRSSPSRTSRMTNPAELRSERPYTHTLSSDAIRQIFFSRATQTTFKPLHLRRPYASHVRLWRL